MVYKHPRKGKKAEPELRWFFERPGRRALELNCFESGPDLARNEVHSLLAGDESTIMRTYLNNTDGVDANECHCFCSSDSLQQKTVKELEEEVEKTSRHLSHFAEEGGSPRRASARVLLRAEAVSIAAYGSDAEALREISPARGSKIKIKAEPTREAA